MRVNKIKNLKEILFEDVVVIDIFLSYCAILRRTYIRWIFPIGQNNTTEHLFCIRTDTTPNLDPPP